MSALTAFERYWFAVAPASRLAALRIVVGAFAVCYLAIGFPELTDVGRFGALHFVPAGPVKLLSTPLPNGLVVAAVGLALVLGVAFLLGFRYRWLAPLFALSFLWVTSYRNSWNMLFHTENLVVIHLLILSAAPAADAYSLDARAHGTIPASEGPQYGWPLRATSWVVVVAYVLAGVAKLKLAGSPWLGGDLLRAQIAWDNVRKLELGAAHSPLGAWLVRFPEPFSLLAWFTLAIELGAPLALLGRRAAVSWIVLAWLFHVGVLALMAIPFWYQLSFVAYAPFLRVERLNDLRLRCLRAAPRRRPPAPAPSP